MSCANVSNSIGLSLVKQKNSCILPLFDSTLFAQDRQNPQLADPHLLLLQCHEPEAQGAFNYIGPDPRHAKELLFPEVIRGKIVGNPATVNYDVCCQ